VHTLFVHAALAGVPFNSSIAALSAWLKQHGHRVSVLIVQDDADVAEVRSQAESTNADIVAFSFMTCRAERVAFLVPEIRRALPSARFIAGGAHPTSYPAETLAIDGLDAVCLGEGESSFLNWMMEPERAHPGILRRGCDDPIARPRFQDVDALPDWDRGLFGDVTNAGNRYEQSVGVALSRGFCPFTCTFCGIDGYRRIHGQASSGSVSLRSVDRCMEEFERVPDAVDVPAGFAIWDAVFPLDRKWVSRFCQAYAERVAEPMAVQLRVEQVTDRLVADLTLAGCDYAVLGLECGDESYRKRFLDKPFANSAAIVAAQKLEAAGIRVHASFMVGLPFETPKMLAQTVRLAQSVGASELSWKYYTPERWTRLYGLCEQNDLLIPKYVDHPFGASEAMIRMTHCSQTDLDKTHAAMRMIRGSEPTDHPASPRPLVELRA